MRECHPQTSAAVDQTLGSDSTALHLPNSSHPSRPESYHHETRYWDVPLQYLVQSWLSSSKLPKYAEAVVISGTGALGSSEISLEIALSG